VYRVSVEVPNAARLTDSNEVRIGGHRVGIVETIEPVTADAEPTAAVDPSAGVNPATGATGLVARVNLKLDESVEPLPRDSIFRVRYRSAFGLKYLEIVRGTGPPAPEGHTFDGTDDEGPCMLPVHPRRFAGERPDSAGNGCFQPQTEFDDIANTFDAETRRNAQENLTGFGDAFAGRGTSLNEAIGAFNPLFRNLGPVAAALVEPSTRFEHLFPALARTAAIVAPVADEQAELFTRMAVAFDAIARDPEALRESISEGVPTLETAIEVLPRQRPFLRHLTTLSRELRPGVDDLRVTLPTLNSALETGTPVLGRSVGLSRRLRGVMRELAQLVGQPETGSSLERLAETFAIADPLGRFVVPAQTVCNYFNYWFTFLPNGLSDRDQVGYSFRQALTEFPLGDLTVNVGGLDLPPPLADSNQVTIPGQVETPVAGYSGVQANGKSTDGVFKPWELPILNGQPYSPAGQGAGAALPGWLPEDHSEDCQAGQNGYLPADGQMTVPGQSAANPANGVSDIPGSRGVTTLYWNQDSTRELRDTRVPSRQPGSWGGTR
jgi:ABC-type transporter Mla subunit MlaD